MRKARLTLIPLAAGLLACTGICSGIGEKLGIGGDGTTDEEPDEAPEAVEAPDGFTCTSGSVAGGVEAATADDWWKLEGEGDAITRLGEFWKLPEMMAAKKAADAHFYCESGGERSGPYLRLTDEPETWVSGHFENGEAHGTWRGGLGDDFGDGDDLRFEGQYSYAQKEGTWTFFGEDEEAPVAAGRFHMDQAHGDWTFALGDQRHEYRYIYGTRHGLWKEEDTTARKSGAFFNGKKHGVWIEETYGKESKVWEETSREVWEHGTSRGDTQRDPLTGEDGARETLKAYLDADLAGGRLSSDGYTKYPVLSDFADETQFKDGDPTYDKAIITHQYVIKDVTVTGATAKITVEYQENCAIIAGETAERTGETNSVEYTLKEQDGFWRLDTPAVPPHTSGKAYMDSIGGPGSKLGKDFVASCGAGDRGGKAGKGGRGEGKGKAGKSGKGTKVGKGKRGKTDQ